MLIRRLIAWPLALFWFALGTRGVEPEVGEKDLPRVPPTEPSQALSTFQIKKGFHLDLVAAEPLVVDPIAMSFDEDGRLYVVEMRDYSERRPERLGRVRRLEDRDGDGRFDRSTVYADDLPWPTAVFCYDGGVFIGATPDILFCKDTNDNGVADIREVVFTGFANDYAPYETNRLNVQALLNSFNWNLDNRIHGSASMSGGKVRMVESAFTRAWLERAGTDHPSPVTNHKSVDLRGRDFSFDPRTLDFRAESGGAQHGMSFDSRGRKFVCSNSDHIQLVTYEDRYASRNPFFAMPPPRSSIAADGPAAEVFRISPDEPWRVIRTRWRVAGLVPGPVEGGGRPSGYFTGATGTTIYRGDAFPEEYRENAFIADCGSNLVHRKKLLPDGVGLIARRPDDEQQVEFLASRDNWFRPVQFANAPDGTLYIADMYREVIEHPWSLPESIKKHLDLNSGNDRGRIYRVAPDGFRQPKRPHLSVATTKELVALLQHPNGWQRDTAARLLYERQDGLAAPLLKESLRNSRSALARMHSLYVLHGLGKLDEATERKALQDRDSIVRQHAVRLTATISGSSGQPWKELTRLEHDPDIQVRYQLAFTLGDFRHPDATKALARIVRRDIGDRWMRAAVLSSLKEGAADLFEQLAADAPFRDSADGREFFGQLAGLIGAKNDPGEVQTVLHFLQKNADSDVAFVLARGLGEGLRNAGASLPRADPAQALEPIFARAIAILNDATVSRQTRIQAIQFLALSSLAEAGATLSSLLAAGRPEPLQLAAVAALARFNDPGVSGALLEHWPQLSARVRGEVLASLLTRPERINALFQAVEERTVSPSEFTAQQLQMLRAHRDTKIRGQAIRLFGAPPASRRDDVVKAYLPALQLRGNPANGKRISLERCATCHRIGGQGHAVGPDLMSVKTAGKETLLVNILDPNREVAPRYLNYTVETKSGESISGLIASESSSSVTLRGPNEMETVVPRAQIERLQPSGQSLMPEGLEVGLTPQDMADLIEYLGVAD